MVALTDDVECGKFVGLAERASAPLEPHCIVLGEARARVLWPTFHIIHRIPGKAGGVAVARDERPVVERLVTQQEVGIRRLGPPARDG